MGFRTRRRVGSWSDGRRSPYTSLTEGSDHDYTDSSQIEDSATSYDSHVRAKRIAGKKKSPTRSGVTLDGLRVFKLPAVASHFESVIKRWYSIPSLVTWVGILFSAFVWWANPERPYMLMLVAVFWRLAYNVGIGYLLKQQSKNYGLTLWVGELRRKPFSFENGAMSSILRGTMPENREVLNDHTLPESFPAWIALRAVVNIVETNDVVAFTMMAIQHGFIERNTTHEFVWLNMLLPLADLIAFLLIGLSLYSKLAARRTAGDYAWYWGDFFFLRTGQVELTYDNIFELFPHPMYTVGYGWTYGCAILARSFEVLACAAGFHLSQMIFLILVENPHVDLLYGSHEDMPSKELSMFSSSHVVETQDLALSKLQKAKSELITLSRKSSLSPFTDGKANVFVIKNFDLYRASDINLVLTLLFYVLTVIVGSRPGGVLDDDTFFIAQAMFWRVFATFVISVILVRQEKTKFWTRHFVKQGLSKKYAFESWKSFYNMLQSLQHMGFLLCAIRLFEIPGSWSDFAQAAYLFQVFFGCLLVITSIWSFQSCYDVLGDYGWFHGDFFISPPVDTSTFKTSDFARRPSYRGIYRYLNNPDAYLGHFWMYGLALAGKSTQMFGVALLSHAMKIAFLQAVEKPHFRSMYKQHVRSSSTALGKAIRGKVSDIRRNETALFLANWVKHPIETGALAPSSEQLAITMCDTMYLGDDSVVVELGPGTGPFTKEILRRQKDKMNTVYLGFELSDEFVNRLRSTFPEVKDNFLCESAERILPVLKKRKLKHCTTIISGLPWAIFPVALQRSILKQVVEALQPGGRFSTFTYLQSLVMPAGQSFKALLDEMFDKVERSPIVWKNLPPAFCYRCEKSIDSKKKR